MSRQPDWEVLSSYWGDDEAQRIRVDKTGVYSPELDYYEDWRAFSEEFDKAKEPFEKYTIVLDRCYYENGVLSDNSFHLDFPAWFAKDVNRIAREMGFPPEYVVDMFCGENIHWRATAYMEVARHHGFHEFDSYSVKMSEAEVREQIDADNHG